MSLDFIWLKKTVMRSKAWDLYDTKWSLPGWRKLILISWIKIGRGADATYTIMSAAISRCHVIIERQGDDKWTITDNKSLNGTAVNNNKLKPLEPYILQDGDIVQFGIPSSPDIPAEFVYRFFSSLKVRREKTTGLKRPLPEAEISVKRQRGSDDDKLHDPEKSEQKEPEKLKALFEEQLQALAQQLKEKEEEKCAIAQQLEEEREQRQVIEEKQKQQEEKVCELDARQKQLVEEKAAVEDEMRQQLEARVHEREEQLRDQMKQQLEQLAKEKKQVEEQLQQEMEKAVQEKDRELQDRLENEKNHLQQIIDNKELEQKALESQLAESRVENEKARADTLSAREAVLAKFTETMETELQCAICNELFVKATSLNCSHAFCSLCIRQWLAVKKECPNCRTAVTSQMRSIVLDSYIDSMVEQLSAEMKERRTTLIAERKVAEEKLDEAENKTVAGPSGEASRNRGRGRYRSRGRGRGRGGGRGGNAAISGATSTPVAAAAAAPAAPTPTPTASDTVDGAAVSASGPAEPVVVVSDVDSDVMIDSEDVDSDALEPFHSATDDSFGGRFSSDSERDSDEDGDEDYVRGRGGYYGGYGRCFKCGARGHWARGCPYG